MKPLFPDGGSKLNIPNLLTGFRFVAAPMLLWLAWHGYGLLFMGLLALAFLSDLLDGYVARLLGKVSAFGAMLDSWADVVIYLTIALGSWRLWPDTVYQEQVYVGLFLASCLLPALVGFINLADSPATILGRSNLPLLQWD